VNALEATNVANGVARLVSGGQITVEVRRAACPPDQRPCGDDCPFQSEAEVARFELRPQSARFRYLAERVYCEALLGGEIEFKPGGEQATIETEIEMTGSETPPAELCPVRSLVVSIAGHKRSVSNASWSRPFLVEGRDCDLVETRRAAPLYWANVLWSPQPGGSGRRTRRGRAPSLRVGHRVRPASFPADWDALALDQPACGDGKRPMIRVVWCDLAGLEAAGRAAAANASRETAFLLLGNPCFCGQSRTAFTNVLRVVPVSRYEESSAVQASISPEALAEVKAAAAAEGLDVVGLLHSHVVEAASEGSQTGGLFYSTTDAEDHDHFLPSAWSMGGVLNVRDDLSVQMTVFARDVEGRFAPLDYLVIPPKNQ
jgi:hypothetical protein